MKITKSGDGSQKLIKQLIKSVVFKSGSNSCGYGLKGQTVERVEVIVATAFNGSGAALNIGKSGALDTYMATAAITEATPGVYQAFPATALTADTEILATLTDADGTTGAATVVIHLSD